MEKVLKYSPDYAEAHYNLGIVYLFLNNKGAALEKYKTLKDLDAKLADKLFILIKGSG